MSEAKRFGLAEFSEEIENLVETVAKGVVAVRAAAYRVVSGVCLSEDLVALPEHELKGKIRFPLFFEMERRRTRPFWAAIKAWM